MATPPRAYAQCQWGFTYNNPTHTGNDLEEILRPIAKQWTFQKEVGENGTPHFQGYVNFIKKTTIPSKLVEFQAHWLRCDANFAKYCCKEETRVEGPWCFGGGGSKTQKATEKKKIDYETAVDLAKQQRIYEIDPAILCRHMASIKQIAKDNPPRLPDNDYLSGIWFLGPPGSGKSSTARWLYPQAYPKMANKWWDGYKLEPYVIIDDLDTHHSILGHHIKLWTDHYPFTAEIKGGALRIRPQIICITSNYSIEEIFGSDFMLTQALKRRFQVFNFK